MSESDEWIRAMGHWIAKKWFKSIHGCKNIQDVGVLDQKGVKFSKSTILPNHATPKFEIYLV